jgi:transcriptional regulator with XRE-family HTH domain
MNSSQQSGLRSRDLRRRNGLTLEQLASQVGISTGHLSRFERGEKSLSVAALIRLAHALDTSTSALLGEEPEATDIHLVRSREASVHEVRDESGHYNYVPLSGMENATHEVFLVTLVEREFRTSVAYHAGRELIYLLRGKLSVRIGGTEIVLEQGDYLEFPGHYQHEVESLAPASEMLVIVLDDQPGRYVRFISPGDRAPAVLSGSDEGRDRFPR